MDIYKAKQAEETKPQIAEEIYRDVKETKNTGFMDKLRNSKAGKYLIGTVAALGLYAGALAKDAKALSIDVFYKEETSTAYMLGYSIIPDLNDNLFNFNFYIYANEDMNTITDLPYLEYNDDVHKLEGGGLFKNDEKYSVFLYIPKDGVERVFGITNYEGQVINSGKVISFEGKTTTLEPATPVPEPSTLLLLASGAAALIPWKMKNRKKE